MDGYTIGIVAKMAEIGVETVRFYEREGLIPQPHRPERGFRRYPRDTVGRLRFIRRAKDLGFTLAEIRELLELRVDPNTNCRDVKRRAEAKMANIDGRIADLRRMKTALSRLADACAGDGTTGECPILSALDQPPKS